MSKWGSADFGAFKDFAKTFEKTVGGKAIEKFIEEFLLEMAFRAVGRIKKRTPVNKDPDAPTRGQLRRSWQVGEVKKDGNNYYVEIYNPTEYASYVEYGHRTSNLKGWVEGRFMMTISMKEIERGLPKFLEQKVLGLLNDIMRGR